MKRLILILIVFVLLFSVIGFAETCIDSDNGKDYYNYGTTEVTVLDLKVLEDNNYLQRVEVLSETEAILYITDIEKNTVLGGQDYIFSFGYLNYIIGVNEIEFFETRTTTADRIFITKKNNIIAIKMGDIKPEYKYKKR